VTGVLHEELADYLALRRALGYRSCFDVRRTSRAERQVELGRAWDLPEV